MKEKKCVTIFFLYFWWIIRGASQVSQGSKNSVVVNTTRLHCQCPRVFFKCSRIAAKGLAWNAAWLTTIEKLSASAAYPRRALLLIDLLLCRFLPQLLLSVPAAPPFPPPPPRVASASCASQIIQQAHEGVRHVGHVPHFAILRTLIAFVFLLKTLTS